MWLDGQQQAVDFAFALGIRPPSLASKDALPDDWRLTLPQREMWFAAPWHEEQAAVQLMRSADASDDADTTAAADDAR